MKKSRIIKGIGIAIVSMLILSGCQVDAKQMSSAGKPIKTITTKEIIRPVELKYKGTVAPESQINYTFKSAGRLGNLYVKAGDVVKKGSVIATLDTSDLNFKLSSASAQLSAAKNDIVKASESYKYDTTTLDRMTKLYENGSISRDQYDQIKLKYDVSQNTLSQAEQNVRAAEANYNLIASLVKDANIVAKTDGTVLKTHYEIGELMGAGAPVVTMRTQLKVVQIGLSQDDKDVVVKDTKAIVTLKDESMTGEIIQLDDMPDLSTRTYLTKVKADFPKLHLGRIVDVTFITGEAKGIWIPMDAVLSQGEKFVYVVQDDRAFKRTISIDEVSGFEVKVEGLKTGEIVVVTGMKNLTDGAKIQMAE